MKKIILLSFIAFSSISFAQNFHVVDDSTALIKSTDQTPAHWYIEVFNDVEPDSLLLRWKAHTTNVPSIWQIDLDDQDNYTTNIQDGDTTDFYLHAGLAFTQKLIIGVTLNNTPGVGSIYFDLYEPSNPSNVVTITYHMIVTQSTASIIEVTDNSWLTQKGNTFSFEEDVIGNDLLIYGTDGRELFNGKIQKEMDFTSLGQNKIVYFIVDVNGEFKSAKFILK